MTTTTMSHNSSIEVTMFDTPSGNVRGMATAFIPFKKGTKRIAHVTFLTDKPAEISVSMPSSMTPDDYEKAIAVMTNFVAKVRELDTQG